MKFEVARQLRQRGPGLTSELIEALMKGGMSAAAARQRITRSQSEYKRLAGLRFAKNARFIYLEDQFGTPEFWGAIERAFKSSGASYWSAVVGLKGRGGCCPASLFPSVCGAPLARKQQLSPARIIERLSAIQLIEEEADAVTGETFIQFRPYSYHTDSVALVRATLLAEFITLQALRDWARRIGFGSYGKFRVRGEDELPVVSGVAWDMTAPSYTRPLARFQNGVIKPGFFVCDVNLHGPIGEDQISAFIRKHDMASAPPGVAPIMPFLVGDVFTQGAFDRARQAGITAVTVADLFGKETAKALRDLIELLSNAGATAAMNPEHLYEVMNALTKIEGAANNLRGALFELAVGSLIKDVEGGYLVTGQKHTDSETGRSAEIDVLVDRPEEQPVLVVECKAKIPGAKVSLEEVERWYSDRVPLLSRILLREPRYRGRSFRFEMWSNGKFDERAIGWMTNKTMDFDDFTLGLKDGKELKNYARRAKSAAIRKTLNEHYFNHPLASTSKVRGKFGS